MRPEPRLLLNVDEVEKVLGARLFRRIERAKRPFIKSQKSEYVWLGEICGIAFLNQQIFAFQEKQFPIAISISRDLQIVIPPIFFAETKNSLQSSPFTVASPILSLHHTETQLLHTAFCTRAYRVVLAKLGKKLDIGR